MLRCRMRSPTAIEPTTLYRCRRQRDGRLQRVIRFAIANGKIVEAETMVHHERLRRLDMAVLNG
jgi:hypothetical protein